tara:strand:- start:11111 stop:12292 length:1182 start_codon:yes stop_codon:yes gene_type:complete
MAIDYTSIDEVVNDFQLMIDDTSYDKDAQIYQLRLLALQGLRELKFDAEQEVKTTEMTVDSTTLQVTLPNDYVKLLRIGYRGDDDEFHPLGYKSDLALDATVTAQVNDDPYDENNPYYHVDMGRKYGVGGGKNNLGYYMLNRNDNTINFSSDIAGKTVFMEYISDGISNVQAKNHVIRFTFNGADGDESDQIDTNCTLKIPKSSSSTEFHTFTFITDTPTTNLQIQFETNDNSGTIAEKFSTLINEGYPDLRISPIDTKIKASQATKSRFVTLAYSDLTAVPLALNNSSFDTNKSQTVGASTVEKIVLTNQELLQLGVVGDGPKVHKFCEEALRCYIYYKYVQRKRGIPANEKQMAKRAYYNEKRLARARMMSFNKETAMAVSRKAFKQSPKM